MATSLILGECAKSFFTQPLTLNRVERYLEADPSCIRRYDSSLQIPLLLVLQNETCSANIVQLLLRNGSRTNHQDCCGDNALLVALRHHRDEAIIRVLLEQHTNVDARNKSNETALCVALNSGSSVGVISLLLDAGCPSYCLNHGTLLHCALVRPVKPINKDLLDVLMTRVTRADLHFLDNKSRTVLCLATRSGMDAQGLELLLSRGGSLWPCLKHSSPMMCATAGSQSKSYLRADMVRLLLEKEAKMDRKARAHPGTALQSALLMTDYEFDAIKLMVDHESLDVNAFHRKFGNLLQLAVRNPCCTADILQLLIDKGVRVPENRQRSTPFGSTNGPTLMEAAMTTGLDLRALKLLFAHGARIDERMVHGDTSLLQFAFSQYFQTPTEEKLDRFLLVLKWFCLQDLERDLGFNAIDHWEFLRFAADCSIEAGRMKLHNLDRNRTLQQYAANCHSTKDDVHAVVRILSKNVFPIYYDTIVDKVDRNSLEAKLLAEVPVYAMSNCTASASKERYKVVLDFKTLSKITQHLSKEELMPLILAYLNH